MPRYVTVILARGIYRYKMAYHIGAVTIVNNREHTLYYAIDEEIKYRTSLMRSAVVIISKGLFLYKRHKKRVKYHGVNVSSVGDLDRTKQRVTPWSKRN